MSRSLIIVLLIATNLMAASEVGAQTKSKRRTPRYGTIIRDVWPPEKGSSFYKLTRALPPISKIEIIRIQLALHPGPLTANEALFDGKVPVRTLGTKTVINRDAQTIAGFWRRLNHASSNACDSPQFWLKFYSRNGLVFETIVSFGCRNLMLSGGESLGFQADGRAGKTLLKKLNALFPQSPNKSLDRSGGSVFRIRLGTANVE
jgi:hypothetical protein